MLGAVSVQCAVCTTTHTEQTKQSHTLNKSMLMTDYDETKDFSMFDIW